MCSLIIIDKCVDEILLVITFVVDWCGSVPVIPIQIMDFMTVVFPVLSHELC